MEMFSARMLGLRQEDGSGDRPSLRDRLTQVIRERARGVDPLSAHARTVKFYRASGHDWSLALR